jgi:DNA polymerase
MAWAFDGEEPQIWTPAEVYRHWDQVEPNLPQPVVDHIANSGEIRAWNASFERAIWNAIMVKRYGALPVAMEQWVCSAAEAAAMALPRSLDQCAEVLKLKERKDDEGHNLMMQMSRPRKINADGSITWWDVEEKKQRLYKYCLQDVRVERCIVPALRRLTPKEREIYLLTERMNDRGVGIDVPLVNAAIEVGAVGTALANAEIQRITDGAVEKVTNHAGVKAWVNARGVETDSVDKASMAELLEQATLPEDVALVLGIKSDAGRTSLSKLKTMLEVANADSRARGLLLYHGAGPGRWTGRLIQPHNFPRGTEISDVEQYIPILLNGTSARERYDLLNCFEHPIVVISAMLRSMLIAADDNDFIAGDFSAIEARVLNWLAGQDDVVAAFAAMDAGDKSKHPYKIMAVKMGRAEHPDLVKKGSDDYQAGKAAELGCGYQMGPPKFVTAAWDVYQVEVTLEQAKQAVAAYRESHARVVQFWWDTINAAMEAVQNPGKPVVFGGLRNLKAIKAGAYLYIVLPSGRPLCYAAPGIKMEPPPWGGEERPTLTYEGMATHGPRVWMRMRTYGGHLVENIVQAVARDLIAEAKLRLESAGYTPLLSVHDEAVCEIPKGFGDLKEFETILAELPAWATGCPVAAEAWRGKRYRK